MKDKEVQPKRMKYGTEYIIYVDLDGRLVPCVERDGVLIRAIRNIHQLIERARL